jgi:hypothetical protein
MTGNVTFYSSPFTCHIVPFTSSLAQLEVGLLAFGNQHFC